ncbi:MAG TPA: M23 family metallopeptidase [Polyangiaceae bacterium]|nr:M23 family metallopeptidase [Polyangiaceae bacterium]
MHPLIRAAAAVFVFVALGTRAKPWARSGGSTKSGDRTAVSRDSDEMSAVCPAGTLPDGDVCVPIPNAALGGEELVAQGAAHHDKRGRFRAYDQIPRRPDRAEAYDVYTYPVAVSGLYPTMSGYDLDLPEAEQRQGRQFSHVGHGGIDLPAPRGAPVRVVRLEHQEGLAAVLFVGKLFGTTVITRHTLREGGRLRDYVLVHGHLDRAEEGLPRGGATVPPGAVLGYVGDTGSAGIVHLHLEVRRVRDDVDLSKTLPERLVANEVSVVCDPRNVLSPK